DLILGKARAILVRDASCTEQMSEEWSGLESHIRPHNQFIQSAAVEALEKLGFHRVGFESKHLSVDDLQTLIGLVPRMEWKPEQGLVESLRQVKDESEIAQIREAIGMAERAFVMFQPMLRPTRS